MNKDGGAAFPFVIEDANNAKWKCGMTMRQAYKMAALSGEAAHRECTGEPQGMAEWAGRMADAMLAEDAVRDGEMGKLRLAKLPEDVRLFIYRVTLHLQENRYKTSEQHDSMFHEAYRLYSRYDVENHRAGERKEDER